MASKPTWSWLIDLLLKLASIVFGSFFPFLALLAVGLLGRSSNAQVLFIIPLFIFFNYFLLTKVGFKNIKKTIFLIFQSIPISSVLWYITVYKNCLHYEPFPECTGRTMPEFENFKILITIIILLVNFLTIFMCEKFLKTKNT